MSCVFMILTGKSTMEGTSGPELGLWGKVERRTGSHPQLASGGTKQGIEWVIAAPRRKEGKLGNREFLGRRGKQRKMSLTSERSREVRPKPEL